MSDITSPMRNGGSAQPYIVVPISPDRSQPGAAAAADSLALVEENLKHKKWRGKAKTGWNPDI